jgi:hypothetical protein
MKGRSHEGRVPHKKKAAPAREAAFCYVRPVCRLCAARAAPATGVLEPIQKVVESDESVVIPYSAPGFFGEVSDVEA